MVQCTACTGNLSGTDYTTIVDERCHVRVEICTRVTSVVHRLKYEVEKLTNRRDKSTEFQGQVVSIDAARKDLHNRLIVGAVASTPASTTLVSDACGRVRTFV